MIADASKLLPRVVASLAFFSLCSASVSVLTPWLLVLRGDSATGAIAMLLSGITVGGVLGAARSWWRLRKHRFVLRSLTLGSRSIEAHELEELLAEDWRITLGWLVPSAAALVFFCTVWRPALIDLRTGISVAVLGTIVVGAAALPLQVLLRSIFMQAIELAPPEVMQDVVTPTGNLNVATGRIRIRLLLAIVMPVAFVAVGSALIASAHLRRADERQREETARALARSALEPKPGLVEGAGLEETLLEARSVGFIARLSPEPGGYRVTRAKDGLLHLEAPLDEGSVTVAFSGSTISVLSWSSLTVALLAISAAVVLGLLIARSLNMDLFSATAGVQHLDTDSVLQGSPAGLRPARFKAVALLGRAIEQLAERFQVFAQAQKRAIHAREAAARMRGLFFASVSHDLKSPLNAILGFTEVIRASERITPGQSESLSLIESRGRELLALIETILDAARVEAGQLNLVKESITVSELLDDAIDKGKDLGGDRTFEVRCDIAHGLQRLHADKVRLSRALATFIGHAARTGSSETVNLRALSDNTSLLLIQVDVPGGPEDRARLEALLAPRQGPGKGEHRGLALALGLARSVIELHGGSLAIESRPDEGTCFVVRLPVVV